ncbi:ribosomal protein large subunit L32 [Thermoplasma volcanium GSS1]|uniref:Large ribosomal subunit protein eL32 n=1 Tax=Thermoplasma volcanium (strain ATCC 51530 / DSM 4299 / JCM 9571 / NBRC 15438 / GSS1) TaxID=273116 RepID=RL32_THEVO|nr:50S ribosomal protein L32e [Thermoplasma volcanium]Q97BV9.1 RecName: Full=Large ribosomal subunit protein eL32; AltName: Full=50S ribosomal protein L32e [Thermoplasma volcanium GSS1]BAB59488.1 ribosomal protein large subunit L32 [Thermoplasma volcanium GSS1]
MNRALDDEVRRLLKIKNYMARKRVEFHRQEWFRYKKLGDAWRKPRGKHSKLREHLSRRPPIVDAGFRSPAKVRGMHPSGYYEVLVYNLKDIENIDPKIQAARIASSVGSRKREEIAKRCAELNIKVLN